MKEKQYWNPPQYADKDCSSSGEDDHNIKNDDLASKRFNQMIHLIDICISTRFPFKKKLMLNNLDLRSRETKLLVKDLYGTSLGNSLHKLSIAQNPLVQVIPPRLVTCLPVLRSLDLSRCELRQLPERWDLPQLQRLDLSHNRLTDFPEETMLEGILELRELNMYGNNVSVIAVPQNPTKVLSKLETLNLGGNDLAYIPEELDQLKSLRVLKLMNNFLENIPMRVCMNMKSLKTIDVSSNPIIQPQFERVCMLTGLPSMKRYYHCLQMEENHKRKVFSKYARKQYYDDEEEEEEEDVRNHSTFDIVSKLPNSTKVIDDKKEPGGRGGFWSNDNNDDESGNTEKDFVQSKNAENETIADAEKTEDQLLLPKGLDGFTQGENLIRNEDIHQGIQEEHMSEGNPNLYHRENDDDDDKTSADAEEPKIKNIFGIDKDEYKYWISRLKKDGWDLQYTPKKLRNDKYLVLIAVRQSGYALKFASPALRNDREVVMAAITQKYGGWALEFASPDLQDDKTIAMEAVKQCGQALKFVSPNLQNDKDVVMAAVQNNGQALQYASTPLRNDRRIVIAAVQQDCSALQFASPELRNDKKVVLIAVKQDGLALRFASSDMQNDKDVVVVAVRNDPDAIRYAHDDIKRDSEVLIASGMFDLDHEDVTQRRQRQLEGMSESKQQRAIVTRKIALSTRFSLNQSSHSQATNFTKILKNYDFFQADGVFKFYAPNAFDKHTCDPDWTNFDHPCRGTKDTCQFDESLKTGHPTDECCWRYSFRYQLEEAKDTGGFLLQLIERGDDDNDGPQTLGNGQRIELDMAKQLQMKIFHVYRPMDVLGVVEENFDIFDIEEVVTAIKSWYDSGCQDMSECTIRPAAQDDDDSDSDSDDGESDSD